MAEFTTCSVIARAKSDVSAMTETLRAQQQLLQKLYMELDEEREASATATTEAMEMILRLQGMKATVEMEANHYKRMAEEKIGHAEATLEAFEELVCQKEMEIASLQFQLQAYKHKLMSLGCYASESDLQDGENDQTSNGRRIHSMPPIPFKSSLRIARKRERSPSPASVSGVIPKLVLESTEREGFPPSLDLTRKSVDSVCGRGTLDSYWNQIKMLDEQVRVISDCNVGENSANLSSRRGRSCSIFSQASTRMTCDQTDRLDSTNSDEVNHGENRKAVADHPCSFNVHDVFEVPQASGKHEKINDNGRKRLEKWDSEAENRLKKPESMSEGMVEFESPVKHDADKQKGMVRVRRRIKTPIPIDMVTITGQKKERVDVDCNSQAEFQKLHQRIVRLERERIGTRHEITREGDGEEQFRLLKDIQSQLKSIQSEMRSLKTEKASPLDDDVSLGPLQEAMLHFWL